MILSVMFSLVQAAIIVVGTANPLYPARGATIPSAGLGELTTNWFTLATPAERYLPLTLEIEAGVSNTDQWGMWVASGGTFYAFYIRSDGYFRTSDPDWQPFAAVRPGVNKLYIYIASVEWKDPFAAFSAPFVPPDHQVTFRINEEIARVERISPGLNSWGVIAPAMGEVEWRSIKIYTSR
jgi:hypothetical protein